jgi:hypothetical protein
MEATEAIEDVPTSDSDALHMCSYSAVSKQVQQQLDACLGAGEWMEDFAQMEEVYGKGVIKVCSCVPVTYETALCVQTHE